MKENRSNPDRDWNASFHQLWHIVADAHRILRRDGATSREAYQILDDMRSRIAEAQEALSGPAEGRIDRAGTGPLEGRIDQAGTAPGEGDRTMPTGAARPAGGRRAAAGSLPAPGVITTTDEPPLPRVLADAVDRSQEVSIATAFLTGGATNPLIQPIRRLLERGGRVRILTSFMNWFNRPEALAELMRLGDGLDLRVYAGDLGRDGGGMPEALVTDPPAFHAKAYLLDAADGAHTVAVGSANFTGSGLGTNVEWAYVTNFEANVALREGSTPYAHALHLFERMWREQSVPVTEELLDAYRTVWRPPSPRTTPPGPTIRDSEHKKERTEPVPRPAQQTALKKLQELRQSGERRGAVIAATGIGKTYLAAFDARNAGAERVLFVAHRGIILEHARHALNTVFGAEPVFIQGRESVAALPREGRALAVAMVQTLGQSEVLNQLSNDAFDYIVIDEFHHSAAETYRRVLEHFRPRFLLGLTATPERTDGKDVLALCDYNVAYEIRLLEAVDRGYLAPFHYYAIYDPTDYRQIRWTGTGYDEQELERQLSQDTRADLIAHNLRLFQPETGKRKALAFCSNTGHAKWMAKAFTDRGIPAMVVIGETPEEERPQAVAQLADESNPLEVVCSVDVFGEGVDVPALTHILMLRPTLSFTVFLQQLGRGLRRAPGKPFLTVLDFVGNFRRSYVAPLALQGIYSAAVTRKPRIAGSEFNPPRGCFIGADTPVERVWQDEIKQVIGRLKPIDRLRFHLKEIAADRIAADQETGAEARAAAVDEVVPLVEPADLATQQDWEQVRRDLKRTGGWLQLRLKLGIADDFERRLEETVGEAFLKHIEDELNAVKSYKMTVLRCLLEMSNNQEISPVAWSVTAIAQCFLRTYQESPNRRADWNDLARAEDPMSFPVKKARRHILKMPLHFMSNDPEKDFFELDQEADQFRLREPVQAYWRDTRFRKEVTKRVEYAEAVYWLGRQR